MESVAHKTKITANSTSELLSYSFVAGSKEVLFHGPLNILLVCIPFALISSGLHWPDLVTFILALLALAPIAERLGYVTEQLAIHTNETIGGLLNATFGNATELIVAISALSKGLYRLVQLSLLGSILSNMLLVLGCAFFFGGLKHKVQRFGKISSQVNSTLLMLSTMGVLLPTMLTMSGQESRMGELGFSRVASVFLFIAYIAFLYFQLISHKDAYEENDDDHPQERKQRSAVTQKPPSATGGAAGYIAVSLMHGDTDVESGSEEPRVQIQHHTLDDGSVIFDNKSEDDADDEEDEEDEDVLGLRYGLVWLAVITVFVTILSDMISTTIERAAATAGISSVFLSAIVLPIVGNAAEHAGAVVFAMKGKLDLSLGVAIGSSTQIALLVMPLLVLIGWATDRDMSLNFGAYESGTLVLTVISVTFAIKDGKSNWLLGISLIIAYIIIATGFWAHKNESLE